MIERSAGSDLPQGFRTTNYVRDWLPLRREQCAKRVSPARRIASQCRWWPSGTGSASRRFTTWRERFGGFQANDIRRLKQLAAENARLKKLVAERDLEIEVMKEVAAKNW
jgi:hypothetical protein